MDLFINETIDVKSGGDFNTVSALLEKARKDKSDLASLMEELIHGSDTYEQAFTKSEEFRLVDGTEILLNFRSLRLYLSDLYRKSNEISNLLDAETAIIMADIGNIERELVELEKAATNYSFLLSDGGSYDYGFIETFSNAHNRDDSINYPIPDRSGEPFMDNEKASVDVSTGFLTMPSSAVAKYQYVPNVVSSNYATSITSNLPVSNIADFREGRAWRNSVRSVSPLLSTLDEFTNKNIPDEAGAKAVIDLDMSTSSKISLIDIRPLASNPVTISQISITDQETTTDLLTSPLLLDRNISISFTPTSAQKVRLYVLQKTYNRSRTEVNDSETFYRNLYTKRNTQLKESQSKYEISDDMKSMSRVFVHNFINKRKGLGTLSANSYSNMSRTYSWGALNSNLDNKTGGGNLYEYPDWFQKDPFSVIVDQIPKYKGIDEGSNPNEFNRIHPTSKRRTANYSYLKQDATLYRVNRDNNAFLDTSYKTPYKTLTNSNAVYKANAEYKYVIGLESVAIGLNESVSRGVFISKPLVSKGTIGEIKLRDDQSYIGHGVSSVEYSISTVATPTDESDWTPIMPSNDTQVSNEFLFTGDKGIALFRFPASIHAGIIVYKNGIEYNIDESNYVYSANYSSIIGISLDFDTISTGDLYTVSYTSSADSKYITFDNSDITVSSSYDENGSGEGFISLDSRNSVTLKHYPYIDYNSVDTSTYDSTLGLNPYQPIQVIFEDGSTAINLSSYGRAEPSKLDAQNSSYQFIHRGNHLIFNKPVAMKFRVYYHFMPNNTRVRVVLRSGGVSGFVSPKVDYYQVKAKLIHPNIKDIS